MTNNKDWNLWTKTELLQLPPRNWKKETAYRSILFVNTRMKHDSGFNLFAIIGCNRCGIPKEICGYMDDFRFGDIRNSNNNFIEPFFVAFDCSMKGVFRLHSDGSYLIKVGHNCSTTNFWLVNVGECSDD